MHAMDSLLMLLVRTHLNVHDGEGWLPACYTSRATTFYTHVRAVMRIAQKFVWCVCACVCICVFPLWDIDMLSRCVYAVANAYDLPI